MIFPIKYFKSNIIINTKIIGLKFDLKYVFSKANTQDIYFLHTIYGALNSYLKFHYLTLYKHFTHFMFPDLRRIKCANNIKEDKDLPDRAPSPFN